MTAWLHARAGKSNLRRGGRGGQWGGERGREVGGSPPVAVNSRRPLRVGAAFRSATSPLSPPNRRLVAHGGVHLSFSDPPRPFPTGRQGAGMCPPVAATRNGERTGPGWTHRWGGLRWDCAVAAFILRGGGELRAGGAGGQQRRPLLFHCGRWEGGGRCGGRLPSAVPPGGGGGVCRAWPAPRHWGGGAAARCRRLRLRHPLGDEPPARERRWGWGGEGEETRRL